MKIHPSTKTAIIKIIRDCKACNMDKNCYKFFSNCKISKQLSILDSIKKLKNRKFHFIYPYLIENKNSITVYNFQNKEKLESK